MAAVVLSGACRAESLTTAGRQELPETPAHAVGFTHRTQLSSLNRVVSGRSVNVSHGRLPNDADFVAFRSANERSFAERKTTLLRFTA